jgi:hypothetical protein
MAERTRRDIFEPGARFGGARRLLICVVLETVYVNVPVPYRAVVGFSANNSTCIPKHRLSISPAIQCTVRGTVQYRDIDLTSTHILSGKYDKTQNPHFTDLIPLTPRARGECSSPPRGKTERTNFSARRHAGRNADISRASTFCGSDACAVFFVTSRTRRPRLL